MIRYKSVLKEEIKQEDISIIIDYLEDKLDVSSFKKKEYGEKNVSYHSGGNRFEPNEYSYDIIYMNTDKPFVLFKFLANIEVSSRSLSDPTRAYQTTSARSVKHKKIKLEKNADSVFEAKKIIDTWVKKIETI